MQINKIIRWNLVLIISIGVYGIIIDESYWKEVGHLPNLYDYFFWFATALNGPSSFAGDYLYWHTGRFSHHDWWLDARFILQYVFWCLLLWPQWKLYEFLANFFCKTGKDALCFVSLFCSLLWRVELRAMKPGYSDIGT